MESHSIFGGCFCAGIRRVLGYPPSNRYLPSPYKIAFWYGYAEKTQQGMPHGSETVSRLSYADRYPDLTATYSV